jgi:hypothetical protein
MTMQKNEKTKNILRGGDMKRSKLKNKQEDFQIHWGMFMSIGPNSWCEPLTKSF